MAVDDDCCEWPAEIGRNLAREFGIGWRSKQARATARAH